MLVGSVWVKKRGKPLNERSVYNLSIQKIASSFSHYLEEIGDNGLIVMDSRRVNQNILTSHSIFTEKYSFKRYKHAPIIESPLFGNSKNHALLQISDIIVSGVLFPLAIQAYCLELEDNIHVSRKYIEIAERFGRDVQNLQYRYIEQDIITNSINYRGGIYVVNKRGVDLFYPHA